MIFFWFSGGSPDPPDPPGASLDGGPGVFEGFSLLRFQKWAPRPGATLVFENGRGASAKCTVLESSFNSAGSLLLYSFYIQFIKKRKIPASLFSIQLLYTIHIGKADSLSEWRRLSFLYSCYIQPNTVKAYSRSEWRPLSFLYSCYIELIQ